MYPLATNQSILPPQTKPKLAEQFILLNKPTQKGLQSAMSWGWSAAVFRWPISLPSFPVFQWPEVDLSYLMPGRRFYSFRWLDLSFVDSLLWTAVMVVESLALVLMLCFFLIFCGCTI
uniref:Uncharacterized protein n=1 Tax=Kalanchoe fedtschenkoi TaxID=63787 RepID=A0A7N0TL67_KALFE